MAMLGEPEGQVWPGDTATVDQDVEWHCRVRLTGLVDGVPAAEVVDLGVARLIADRVVEPDNVELLVDLVDGDLVVGAADAERSAAAFHRQRVVGPAHVQRLPVAAIESGCGAP